VSIDGERLSPANLLRRLNQLAGAHGIGRVDMVENRFVGLRSRGVYETPGGTVLHAARRAVESITMDRDVMHERDRLAPRFAELIYNGFWFAPEMEFLRAAIDASQRGVTGEARVRLFKGALQITGRRRRCRAIRCASPRSTRREATTSATRAASSASRVCASRGRGD
jgi:argininosuccinate synthase